MQSDHLTKADKQKIATTLGYSETAFISSSSLADFRFDFFTPSKQIPHCGHATIGSFGLMDQFGLLNKAELVMETIAGTNKIFKIDGKFFMEQTSPAYTDVSEVDAFLSSLNLKPSQVTSRPVIVNTANSYLLAELTFEALQTLQPNQSRINTISEKYDLIGYYLFSRIVNEAEATTRMFAPRYGIKEESATGTGAGPLGCYLFDILKVQKQEFVIQQGYFMKPPALSELNVHLKLKNGKISSLLVGGDSRLMEEKEIVL